MKRLVLVNDVVEQWYLVRNGFPSMLDPAKAHAIRDVSEYAGTEPPEGFQHIDRNIMTWNIPDSLDI